MAVMDVGFVVGMEKGRGGHQQRHTDGPKLLTHPPFHPLLYTPPPSFLMILSVD